MTGTMTGRQRMLAAYHGERVDRVPIWLRGAVEGFPVGEPYPASDDFSRAWMHDPLYKALYNDISPHLDALALWDSGDYGWGNRLLMVPPDCIHTTEKRVSPDVIHIEGSIDTPRGRLTFVDERRRGYATTWYLKPPVETVEDLKKLGEVPFGVRPSDMDPLLANCRRALEQLGDRGLALTSLPSPIVCISRCMHFDTFLEMTLTQNALFHELLRELSRRGLAIIDCLFKGRALDTVVTFGGSEQCTPPMMSARAYDEFVVPYDGPMVARLKELGPRGLVKSCGN